MNIKSFIILLLLVSIIFTCFGFYSVPDDPPPPQCLLGLVVSGGVCPAYPDSCARFKVTVSKGCGDYTLDSKIEWFNGDALCCADENPSDEGTFSVNKNYYLHVERQWGHHVHNKVRYWAKVTCETSGCDEEDEKAVTVEF